MMEKAVCQSCGSYLAPNEDIVRIIREGPNPGDNPLWFHTECFKEVSGEEYIPRSSPHPKEYLEHLKECPF